jgi:hypothetical protein
MATMQVLNAIGGTETVEKPMSVENNALLTSILAAVDGLEGKLDTLNTAVASTTPTPVEIGPFSSVYLTSGTNAAVQAATAAAGDYLQHFVLQPTTTSPGAFTLYDGSTSGTNSTKYTHPGGASSLSNLAPIIIGITANCVNAGWHITIVSGWTVTLVGRFS